MKQTEIVELFGLISAIWPNSDINSLGKKEMLMKAQIWERCLQDVYFEFAKAAVFNLAKKCKFAPTIAELREEVERTSYIVKERLQTQWNLLKLHGADVFDEGNLPAFVKICLKGKSFDDSCTEYFSLLDGGSVKDELLRLNE